MVPKFASRLALPATGFLLVIFFVAGFVSSVSVELPKRCRTEGRLILSYTRAETIFRHQYTFSEYLDPSADQAKVTIGHLTHPPTVYYKRKSDVLMLSPGGVCQKVAREKTSFVPEISWFLPLISPIIDSKNITNEIGPSGFLRLFFSKDQEKLTLERSEVHRNMECSVYRQNTNVQGIFIQLEVFIPKGAEIVFDKMNLPTAKAKLLFTEPPRAFGQGITEAGFEIDYFYISNLDNPAKIVSDRSDLDSNIPEGSGCSEFLNQIEPNLESQSFSMIYKLKNNPDYTMLAYDVTQNLLKREAISEQASIWDLEEELLYNLQPNVTSLLREEYGLTRSTDSCSVIKVTDKRLSSTYRPLQEANQKQWDIRSFLGAQKLAYIGKGNARELPCLIYETIVNKIPPIFGDSYLTRDEKTDYIIQFYLVESLSKDLNELSEKIQETSFWPARITLLARNKEQDSIVELNQVDVDDFYWSLDGRNKRRAELFIVDECFYEEGERMRLELSLTFDGVHTGMVVESKKKLLAVNKFKLEYDLLNIITKLLSMNRINLISSDISLHPNHVLLDLTFGDRMNTKALSYFGEGSLITANSYVDNRLVANSLTEEKCLMLSSHIQDTSVVIFCPKNELTSESTCTSIFSEAEPSIRMNTNSSDSQLCRVYRFVPGEHPAKRAINVLENSWNLTKLNDWAFSAKDPQFRNTEIQLSAHLVDYDLSFDVKLITINQYRLADDLRGETGTYTSNLDVRSFGLAPDGKGIGFKLEDAHDCARICNLDPWCRSYSFCTTDTTCLISKLDLRKSIVREKLAAEGPSKTIEGRHTIEVSKVERYELLFAQGCNIYERNYLEMFNPTKEILTISKSDLYLYPTALSTFECAKLSVASEMKSSLHHVSMFAFCPSQHVNSCLLDEKLLRNFVTREENDSSTNEDQYIKCRLYKRRFHTYFNMSTKVVKVQNPTLQTRLPFKMVEDCARACLTQYGQVCSSFDFCPNDKRQSCIINGFETSLPEVELVIQPGCSHYERDLRFDEILSKHITGRLEPLATKPEQQSQQSSSFWTHLVALVSYCIVAGMFVFGMSLGKRANDELDSLLVRLKSRNPTVGQSFVNLLNSSNYNSARRTSDRGSSNSNAIELEDCRVGGQARG